jgi:hypothetical protein
MSPKTLSEIKIHVSRNMKPNLVVIAYWRFGAAYSIQAIFFLDYNENFKTTNNAEQASNHAFFHNAKYYFLTKATIRLHVFWDATLFTSVQNTEDSKERIYSYRKRQPSHSSSEMAMVYSYTISKTKIVYMLKF